MGGGGGEKVGRLEITLIFHPSSSLDVAVEARQALVVLHMK